MQKSNLKTGMIQIFIANIFNLLFSLGTNFLLPKYLSVNSYSQIKTYQLYITYVALLHLGYNDGMYLKYGGKKIDEISKEELKINLSTLRVFQFFISTCCVIFSIIINDYALFLASIAVLPQNVIAYFKNLYQAIGEFKRYSRIMNLTTGLTFAINLFLVLFIKTDNYIYYLICYVILLVILWLVLEYSLRRFEEIHVSIYSFSWKELKLNISSGILLLLGNFSSQIITSMDRWFVKFLMTSSEFAFYSFAVSIENFINVATIPITVTLFNYFCNHDNKEDILRIRDYIMLIAVAVVSVAFPVKLVMEIYLRNYLTSTMVIFTLFTAHIFYIVIKGVYVNLYKSRKMQNRYFTKLCIIIILAFFFNIICYSICKVKESFAVGTLLSAIVWFIISQKDFKELKYSFKYYVFIFSEAISFWLCGYFFEAIIGFIIYFTISIVLALLCMPKTVSFFFKTGKEIIFKYFRKK